jgi:hypothetical protein
MFRFFMPKQTTVITCEDRAEIYYSARSKDGGLKLLNELVGAPYYCGVVPHFGVNKRGTVSSEISNYWRLCVGLHFVGRTTN